MHLILKVFIPNLHLLLSFSVAGEEESSVGVAFFNSSRSLRIYGWRCAWVLCCLIPPLINKYLDSLFLRAWSFRCVSFLPTECIEPDHHLLEMNQNHLDLEDWELLPDEGFLEINQYDSGKKKKKKIYLRNDYFICPPERSPPKFVDTTRYSTIAALPHADSLPGSVEEEVITEKVSGADDPVSQVFFNKARETQHLDIKVESPRSKGISMPQIEGAFHLDIIGDAAESGDLEKSENDGDGAFNIWKWSSSGIGAIYSFSIAAAAVCIVIFSGGHSQKLHFPISHYAQGKDETGRLPYKTIMAVRGGAPVARARITFGGYYKTTV